MTKTVDTKSYALAELLLADHPELAGRQGELAVVLQEAAEDWIENEKSLPARNAASAKRVADNFDRLSVIQDEEEEKRLVLSAPDRFDPT